MKNNVIRSLLLKNLEELRDRGGTEGFVKGKKDSQSQSQSQSQKREKKIRKKRWVPASARGPHPNQVTVKQCCQYLELRDYPIQVNQTLKERFQDKRKFDDYATPLLKVANPRAHPLILSTLLRAKWFEVMNTETGGGSSSQPPTSQV